MTTTPYISPFNTSDLHPLQKRQKQFLPQLQQWLVISSWWTAHKIMSINLYMSLMGINAGIGIF